MLDAQWDGSPGAAMISEQMTADMHQTGWTAERFAVIVIEPELENWVWSTSPHVATALGWDRDGELRQWLVQQDLWSEAAAKPADPKAAMEVAMREIRQPRSSAIYRKLAARVSLAGCEDQALARLLEVLRGWFPVAEAE